MFLVLEDDSVLRNTPKVQYVVRVTGIDEFGNAEEVVLMGWQEVN